MPSTLSRITTPSTRSRFIRSKPVRLYLVNVVEFDPINSLHLHGNFFDYYDHGTTLTPTLRTVDTVMQCQAQRGIVEFTYKDHETGLYMFHAHQIRVHRARLDGHVRRRGGGGMNDVARLRRRRCNGPRDRPRRARRKSHLGGSAAASARVRGHVARRRRSADGPSTTAPRRSRSSRSSGRSLMPMASISSFGPVAPSR